MEKSEAERAVALVRDCFDRYVAGDYPPHGRAEFYLYAEPAALARRQGNGHFTLVAVEDGRLLGVLEMRLPGHICLCFVAPHAFRRGVATALCDTAIARCQTLESELMAIEVNASPYGEAFYKKYGFAFVGPREEKNGIIFTPMTLNLQSRPAPHKP